jgi:predicted nuclease of predicted toxin-antitoxin system
LTAFLLDANLSPETTTYLRREFGFDVVDLQSIGLGGLDDVRVIDLAVEQGRVIVTHDLDFGQRYHQASPGAFGAIVLRLNDQTTEAVNRVLDRFFRNEATNIPLERSLVILTDERIRTVTTL